jgi:hypothetical protein
MKAAVWMGAVVMASLGLASSAFAAGGLNPVPEPASIALVGIALVGVIAATRRGKK